MLVDVKNQQELDEALAAGHCPRCVGNGHFEVRGSGIVEAGGLFRLRYGGRAMLRRWSRVESWRERSVRSMPEAIVVLRRMMIVTLRRTIPAALWLMGRAALWLEIIAGQMQMIKAKYLRTIIVTSIRRTPARSRPTMKVEFMRRAAVVWWREITAKSWRWTHVVLRHTIAAAWKQAAWQ